MGVLAVSSMRGTLAPRLLALCIEQVPDFRNR
jgi:hypothetical protein